MFKVNNLEPKLTMGVIARICKKADVKSASELIAKIHSCSENVSSEPDQPKFIIIDLVTYTELAITILTEATAKQELTEDQIEDALCNFDKVNELVVWAVSEIVVLMSPSRPN
jgi:hypothetical protein